MAAVLAACLSHAQGRLFVSLNGDLLHTWRHWLWWLGVAQLAGGSASWPFSMAVCC